LVKTAVGCIQKETAAASGQRERVSYKATALPGLARDSPVFPRFQPLALPKEGFPRVPQLAVRKRPTNLTLRLRRAGQESLSRSEFIFTDKQCDILPEAFEH